MYIYRCGRNDCRKQVAKKRKLSDYKTVKPTLCPGCGCNSLIDITKRKKRERRAETCRCDGVHYPHRKGSIIWCKQHPTGPTEQDYQDRYVY